MVKKTRTVIPVLLCAALLLCIAMLCPPQAARAEEGEPDVSWYNSANKVYILTSAEQLAGLAEIVNGTAPGIGASSFSGRTVSLDRDLDLSGFENWTPIGDAAHAFSGTFDGGGHTISGLNINAGSDEAPDTAGHLGLFGNISKSAAVRELSISGSVTAVFKGENAYVGGLAGRCEAGEVSDITCSVSVTVSRASGSSADEAAGCVGGLAGCGVMEGEAWSYCMNVGDVTGPSTVGGLAGSLEVNNADMGLQNCGNTGSVTRADDSGAAPMSAAGCTGGLVGYAADVVGSAEVHHSRCFNSGDITDGVSGGESYAGGLFGSVKTGRITELFFDACYNTGSVSGESYAGGLAGNCSRERHGVYAESCYNAGIIAGAEGKAGEIFGRTESDTPVINELSIVRSCYLKGGALPPIGEVAGRTGTVLCHVLSSEQLQHAADDGTMLSADSFRPGDPYPVLKWQSSEGYHAHAWDAGTGAVSENGVSSVTYHCTVGGCDRIREVDALEATVETENGDSDPVSFVLPGDVEAEGSGEERVYTVLIPRGGGKTRLSFDEAVSVDGAAESCYAVLDEIADGRTVTVKSGGHTLYSIRFKTNPYTVTMKASKKTAESGDELTLDLIVSGDSFRSFVLTAVFPAAFFDCIGVETADESASTEITSDNSTGYTSVTVRRSGDEALPDGTAAASLKLKTRMGGEELPDVAPCMFRWNSGLVSASPELTVGKTLSAERVRATVTITPKFPVTFLSDTGEELAVMPVTIREKPALGDFPDEPVREGSDFMGWQAADGGSSAPVLTNEDIAARTVRAPVTYRAVFAPSSPTAYIEISGDYRTEYTVGDEFDKTGVVVTATREDGSTKNVSAGAEFAGFDSETAGEKTVTVSYGGKSAELTVTVKEPPTVTVTPSEEALRKLWAGDAFTADLVLTHNGIKAADGAAGFISYGAFVNYDAEKLELTGAETAISGAMLIANTRTGYLAFMVMEPVSEESAVLCTLSFAVREDAAAGETEISAVFDDMADRDGTSRHEGLRVIAGAVTVTEPPTAQSIAVSGLYKTAYVIGEDFDGAGIVVTAAMSDGTEQDVTADTVFYGFDSDTAGEKTVTAACGELTAEFTVTVNEPVPELDPSLNGLMQYEGRWLYFSGGRHDTSFTGLVENEYGWWYVENGELDFGYTGLAENEYGSWYIVNSRLDLGYTGLAEDASGWMYIYRGMLAERYSGLVENEYGWWYVADGRLDFGYTGLVQNEYGWWYVEGGRLGFGFTGLAENEYGWWYIENSRLDLGYSGIVQNDYGRWYIENGRLDLGRTGLVQIGNEWWFIYCGMPAEQYSGLVENEYGWWYVADGRLDFGYTGLVQNEYGWWYVANGQLDFGYTGPVTNEYGEWYVVNGQVVS